jgi:two-component system, NtrC family, sensor histidine kinase PilS
VRILIALVVLAVLWIGESRWMRDWLSDPALFTQAAAAYGLGNVIALAVLSRLKRGFHLQLAVQALLELAVLIVMVHATGGLRGGLGVLMVASVAVSAAGSTRLMAASFAAIASLLMLGEAGLWWLQSDTSDSGVMMIAGLVGGACFVTAMLVNWLATQLRRQEGIARARGEDLRNQLAVTARVVAELEQGVLVVSPDATVRAVNPAARELLGASESATAAALDGIVRACAEWRRSGDAGGLQRELLLPSPGGEARRILVRFLDTPGGDAVLMLEDPRRVEERAQQLKLASMGRLSASIAHEIRNPLGAIRHANSLLAEGLLDSAQQRLARIVEDNTVRIDRVVSDVLTIARRERPGDEAIQMQAFLSAFVEEFSAQAGAAAGRIAWSVESDLPMRFDPNHLRQVLVNLVGNALRYASDARPSVMIGWRERGPDRLELQVADDGPGLPAEMQSHAFEPFFTTESSGTGLGLFLARELCVANGASIRFEPPAAGRWSAFVIEPGAHGQRDGNGTR